MIRYRQITLRKTERHRYRPPKTRRLRKESKGFKMLPQLFFPIRHMESSCLELGQVKSRMNRARCDGSLGTCIIIGGTHRNNLIAIAVSSIEDRTGNLRPALDCTGCPSAAWGCAASACPRRWRAPSRGSRCGYSRRRTTGRPPCPSRRSRLARRACAAAPAYRWCRRRTEA